MLYPMYYVCGLCATQNNIFSYFVKDSDTFVARDKLFVVNRA